MVGLGFIVLLSLGLLCLVICLGGCDCIVLLVVMCL